MAWKPGTRGLVRGCTRRAVCAVALALLVGMAAAEPGWAEDAGAMWGWGANPDGAFGNGTTTGGPAPVMASGLVDLTRVSGGGRFSVALRADGTVWTTGQNFAGQLGDGTTVAKTTFVQAVGLSGVIEVDAGTSHAMAVTEEGTVYAWGFNSSGQLGDGATTSRNTPAALAAWGEAVAVDLGDWHSLVARADGTVWGSGKNDSGQLGNGTATSTTSPVQAQGLTDVVAVAAGRDNSMALKSDGTLWCWGAGLYGQLGNGASANSLVPVQVSGMADVASFACGGSFIYGGNPWGHCAAVKSDGTVWTWGYNQYGQLGIGTTGGSSNVPVQVPGINDAVAVACGVYSTIVAREGGTVWGWGYNSAGELGEAVAVGATTANPVQVAGISGALTVSAGGQFSLAVADVVTHTLTVEIDPSAGGSVTLDPDKAEYTHGEGVTAQATAGSGYAFAGWSLDGEPVGHGRFPSVQISLWDDTTLTARFIRTGTAWCWGRNQAGQLGDGTTTDRNLPGEVGSLENVAAMALGGEHGVALRGDGTVWAWGENGEGQLGDGTTTDRGTPVQVTDPADASGYLTNVVLIAAGEAHTMALKRDGTVWCWGRNLSGQLGNNSTTQSTTPVQAVGLSGVVDIAAGANHSLAISLSGQWGSIYAWGESESNQLGSWRTTDSWTPLVIMWVPSFRAVAAGRDHTLALSDDGTVWACGGNAHGQLGDGTTAQNGTLTEIPATAGAVALAAGDDHSLCALADGSLLAWGGNAAGQIGDGTVGGDQLTPVAVHGEGDVGTLQGVAAVAAGFSNSMAVASDGTLWAWGDDTYGQLGNGADPGSATPVRVKSSDGSDVLAQVTEASAGGGHAGAVVSSCTVTVALPPSVPGAAGYVWPNNPSHLFRKTVVVEAVPPPGWAFQKWEGPSVDLLDNPFAERTALTVLGDAEVHPRFVRVGTVWCWGLNSDGQLGNGTSGLGTHVSLPSPVYGLGSAVSARSGDVHTVALKADGTVWAWGSNDSGQLGDGTRVARATPGQVLNLANVLELAAGAYHTLALKRDGTVWAWGLNSSGELGDGTTDTRDVPVQVSGLTGVVAIAAGTVHSLALKSDGTVWAWGANNSGQLGDGSVDGRLLPVQVADLPAATRIAAGGQHSIAVDTSGEVWTWGANDSGQLGDGSLDDRLLPVQVSGLPEAVAVAAGYSHSLCAAVDGGVWAWGSNADGELGDGSTTQRLTPVQVAGPGGAGHLGGIVDVRSGQGSRHSLALDGDGVLWVWGYNFWGQLGDGTETDRTTPVQVQDPDGSGPLMEVAAASGGLGHTAAVVADQVVSIQLPPDVPAAAHLWPDKSTYQFKQTVQIEAVPPPGSAFDSWGGDTKSIANPFSSNTTLAVQLASQIYPRFVRTGTLYCWGSGVFGQLGTGASGPGTKTNLPQKVPTLSNVIKLSAGLDNTVALRADGTVWCWGENANGQLGDGTLTDRAEPVQVIGLPEVASVAAGFLHTLALARDGTVWSWGGNAYGQLGSGAAGGYRTVPAVVPGLSGVVAVAAGSDHSMALKADGTVWCWGANQYGELGDGNGGDVSDYSAVPVQAAGPADVAQVSACGCLSMAMTSTGEVWTWGQNSWGQIGDGTTDNRLTPFLVPELPAATSIASAETDALLVADDGRVWGWGQAFGATPATVPGPGGTGDLEHIVSVRGMGPWGHFLATDEQGRLWAWGANQSGQLGDGTFTDSDWPVQVRNATDTGPLQGVTAAACGQFHSAAVISNCVLTKIDVPGGQWTATPTGGSEGQSQPMGERIVEPVADDEPTVLVLESGQTVELSAVAAPGWVFRGWGGDVWMVDDVFAPEPVMLVGGEEGVEDVEIYPIFVRPGRVYAWGDNGAGQLGDGTGEDRTRPVAVNGLDDVVDVRGGEYHTLALRADGTVWAWGNNYNGQLGDGTNGNHATPIQVCDPGDPTGFLTGVARIVAGSLHSVALKCDGTVWCWGDNDFGQLGNGTSETVFHSTLPVHVTGLDHVIAIGCGPTACHTLAVRSDRTVWVWGSNAYGQLGNGVSGAEEISDVPVQVDGLNDIVAVSAGCGHSLALTHGGTVWAWGHNQCGQLGVNSAEEFILSPAQVHGLEDAGLLTGIRNIVAGYSVSYARGAPNGTLYAWGCNTHGELGLGDEGPETKSLIPLPIEALGTSVPSVVAGNLHALAVDGLDRVRAWGGNDDGQLGDGSTEQQTAPVGVLGPGSLGELTGVSVLAAGMNHGLAVVPDHTVTVQASPGDGGAVAVVPDQTLYLVGDTVELIATPEPGWVFTGWKGDVGTIDEPFNPTATLTVSGDHWIEAVFVSPGEVWTWGYNGSGQLGDGTTTHRLNPVVVSGRDDFIAVDCGHLHTVALAADGTVWTWGGNFFSQLGIGTSGAGTDSAVPVQVVGPGGEGHLTGVVAVSAGELHSAALKADGTVYCWGNNGWGQLGIGTSGAGTDSSVPVEVLSASDVIAVSAGTLHTLALRKDGRVWAWGDNACGQLGDGTFTSSTTAVLVQDETTGLPLAGIRDVAAGAAHSLAVQASQYGEVIRAWGSNEYVQLGVGYSSGADCEPWPVLTWEARDEYVQLGDGSGSGFGLPQWPQPAFGPFGTVDALSAGGFHTLAALDFDSDWSGLWATGYNDHGQLGDGTQRSAPTWICVVPSSQLCVWAVAGGLNHSLAVGIDGTVWAWGANEYGAVGDGTTTERIERVQVVLPGGEGPLDYVTAVAAGADFSAALRPVPNTLAVAAEPSDGGSVTVDPEQAVYNMGEVVDVEAVPDAGYAFAGWTGDTDALANPRASSTTVTVSGAMTLGARFVRVGTVQAWGRNDFGQLGNGTRDDVHVPVPAGLFGDVVDVAAGHGHTLALTAGGWVYAWGNNDFGQLGDGSAPEVPDSLLPVRVKSPDGEGWLTDIVAIAAGFSHSVALRRDGTVLCWGVNLSGQLGDGSAPEVAFSDLPVQVPDLADVVAIGAGDQHTLAARRDATAWAWGDNIRGQLGNGTSGGFSDVPVQVVDPGDPSTFLQGVVAVTGSMGHSLALLGDGTLRAWGANDDGQLGDGTTSDSPVPVTVLDPGGELPLGDITHTAAGPRNSYARTAAGHFYAWGDNLNGELGNGDHGPGYGSLLPIEVVAVADCCGRAAAGDDHAMTLNPDGAVWAWGGNLYGQLGNGTTVTQDLPVRVGEPGDELEHVTAIAAGFDHSVAVTGVCFLDLGVEGEGSIAAAPEQEYYRYGQVVTLEAVPAEAGWAFVAWTGDVAALADAGDATTTVTMTRDVELTAVFARSAAAFACGQNAHGELGDGTNTGRLLPTPVVSPPDAFVAAAGGYHYSLGLAPGGQVYAWGRNDLGQLGDGTSTERTTPGLVALSDGPAVAAAAGGGASAALLCDGTVRTWGWNDHGRLGDGTEEDRNTPVGVVGPQGTGLLDNVVQVTAGGAHMVALRADGSVWAWGSNYYGQLGRGTQDSSAHPIPLQVRAPGDGPDFLANITCVAAGDWHTLALDSEGAVWAWGDNACGQLGDGTTLNRYRPVRVQGLDGITVVALAGGGDHSLVLDADGHVWAWGANACGELGDGTQIGPRRAPVQVMGLADVVAIAAGYCHSVAIRQDGTVWTWGHPVGCPGAEEQSSVPVQAEHIRDAVHVAAGRYFTTILGRCVHHVSVSAASGAGGSVTVSPEPDEQSEYDHGTVVTVTATADAGWHFAGWKGDIAELDNPRVSEAHLTVTGDVALEARFVRTGRLWAWGDNFSGQLGDGTTEDRHRPVAVTGLEHVVDVRAGASHTLALKSDGTVWASGSNLVGELGDGAYERRSEPVQVRGAMGEGWLTGVVAIAAGYHHSVALTSDGSVFCWGRNEHGELGTGGAPTYSALPLLVTGISDVVAIAAGGAHTLAVGRDGSCWAWGDNLYGAVGDGTTVDRPVPVQVDTSTGLPGVAVVDGGRWFSLALAADGSAWAWGRNAFGQLGDGSTTDRHKPVPVSGEGGIGVLQGISGLAAGGDHSVALHADGTVCVWGSDQFGQLGQGGSIPGANSSLPVEVAGLGNVTVVDAGFYHSVALGDDGRVWAWGRNEDGQLGDGTTTDRSAPSVVVGSGTLSELTHVSDIAAGYYHTVAIVPDCTVTVEAYPSEGGLVNLMPPQATYAYGDVIGLSAAANPGWVFAGWKGDIATLADPFYGGTTLKVTDDHVILAVFVRPCEVHTWGSSYKGQLGDGSTSDRAVPGAVPDLNTIIALSCGTNHVLALDAGGTVWAWGDNSQGQVGDGTYTSRDTPVRVEDPDDPSGLLTGVVAISAGGSFSLAVKADGTVWGWGENTNGQLGIGSTSADETSPLSALDVTDVIAVAAGSYHTLALRKDGTVLAWGSNYNGQLGDGTTTDRLTAVTVLDTTGLAPLGGVIAIGAGQSHSLALLSDGRAVAWGCNANGQVGCLDLVDHPLPQYVRGIGGNPVADTVDIAAGDAHSLCVHAGGTAWAWGVSMLGRLGDGNPCPTADKPYAGPVAGESGRGYLRGASRVAGADYHSLALMADGTVRAWGRNLRGEVGDNTTETRYWPVPVVGPGGTGYLDRVQALAGGFNFSAALRHPTPRTLTIVAEPSEGGTVTVTPDQAEYDHTTEVTIEAVADAGWVFIAWIGDVETVADPASAVTTIAMDDDCEVAALFAPYAMPLACGNNSNGQLGDATTDNRDAPVPVAGLSDLVAVAGGGDHSLALGGDGTVWAWGDNWWGQLGDGTTDERHVPTAIGGLEGIVIDLSAGCNHSAAVLSDGTVMTWGNDEWGQLGDSSAGSGDFSTTAAHVVGPGGTGQLAGVVQVATGNRHTLALRADHTVWAWGCNSRGELGNGSQDNGVHAVPVQVVGHGGADHLEDIVAVAAGMEHSLAVRADGAVFAWGSNWWGQLGDGSPPETVSTVPVQVTGLADAVAVAAGGDHSVALKDDGTVWAWGRNGVGQLGDGTDRDSLTPVQVLDLTGIVQIACGRDFTLARREDGTVWGWGANAMGQLGCPAAGDHSLVRVRMQGVTEAISVAAGYYHGLVLGEPAPIVLEIAAEVTTGEEWVYQNTETTTDDRHISTATITLVSEATPGEVYDISIADDGPDGANFTLGAVTDNRGVDDTMTVEIVGGRVGASTIGAGGAAYNVTITFQGQTSGQSDSAQVEVSLLRIGDIDRDGSLTGTDRQLFNQRLNNVATPYTDRTFDLDGSGGAPTGTDKQVMNQALNNVPLP